MPITARARQPGYRFFHVFLAVTMMAVELDHIVRGGEPYIRTRGMIAPRSVHMAKAPTR